MTVWFALVFYVYLETGSVIVTSVTNGLYFAAGALLGFWFGGLVDRHKKKRAMMASSLVSLFIYAIGFAAYLAAPEGVFADPAHPMLWIVIALIVFGVVVGNVRNIALATVITILIPAERRDRANGLAGMATGLAFSVVSAISGLLVGLAGLYWVFILAVGLTAATILHLMTVSIPEEDTTHMTEDAPTRLPLRGTLAVIMAIPGLLALIFFTTFNNLLGGVFAGLMDAYGLSLVSVEAWGILWAFLSLGFIVGGFIIARRGLGSNPLRTLFAANIACWTIGSLFMIRPSIVLLTAGMFLYLCIVPFIEASEHTIIQKVVPQERQGRVFGFAQSVEMASTPLTTFIIGPVAEILFIPFMTTGAGVALIGSWFGTGPARGIALVFTLTSLIGLVVTLVAMRSKYYRLLSERYMTGEVSIRTREGDDDGR